MVLTEFLRNIQNNPGLLNQVAGQGKGISSIAGTNPDIERGGSTVRIQAQLRQNQLNIAEGNAALQQQLRQQQREFNRVTSENLISLGQSVTDVSQSLGQTSTQIFDVIGKLNERLSGQVSDLGLSVSDASKAAGQAASQGGNILTGNIFGVPNVALLGGAAILILVAVLK